MLSWNVARYYPKFLISNCSRILDITFFHQKHYVIKKHQKHQTFNIYNIKSPGTVVVNDLATVLDS